jgi:hypothetical protein
MQGIQVGEVERLLTLPPTVGFGVEGPQGMNQGCGANLCGLEVCSRKNEQIFLIFNEFSDWLEFRKGITYTIIPAATVSLVPGSIRMKEPVERLRR